MFQKLSKSLCIALVLAYSFFSGIYYQDIFPHVPVLSDEQGYLFIAETFEAGRLTNPPLKNKEFFETMHFNYGPTFHSKYPPGIAMPYYLAKIVGQHPLSANVLMFTLTALVLFVLMRQRFDYFTATLTTFLFVGNFRLLAEWVNGYRSGLMTMIGSCLVLYPLLSRKHQKVGPILYGIGASLLMWSRPYEGFLICATILIVLLKQGQLKQYLKYSAPTLAIALSLHLYYNYRTTENVLNHPHLLHTQDYYQSSDFIFAPDHPPKHYSNDRLKRYYVEEYERPHWVEQRTLKGFWKWLVFKFEKYTQFYMTSQLAYFVLFIIALYPFLPGTIKSLRPVVIAAFFALLSTTSGVTLYTAALAPLFYIMFAHFFHRIRQKSAVLSILLITILVTYSSLKQISNAGYYSISRYENRSLFQKPYFDLHFKEKSLVFIDYASDHNNYDEWVINTPNFEEQQVIYAIDKGPQNSLLMNAYPERVAYRMKIGNSAPYKLTKLVEDSP